MNKITNINDELSVREVSEKNRTIISLIDGDEETLLLDVMTDQFFSGGWVSDENYIVAYSIGCMLNQIPPTIESAYSIKDKKFLNVSNEKIKSLLENMLIYKKRFNLDKVLTAINKSDLGILLDREKNDLVDYLTSGNKNLSRDMVVEYILKKYPKLREYTNLKGNLSVSEYRGVEKEFAMTDFWFNAMPQDLKFVSGLQNDNSNDYTIDIPKIKMKKRI